MKKNIFLTITAFILGFLIHAFFFPDFLANALFTSAHVVLSNEASPSVTPQTLDPLIREITFDGTHFSRNTVSVGRTRYLSITNSSDKLMDLISNVEDLRTPRGYGKGELVKAQFNKPGTFVVQDKNNTSEQLTIIVK